MLYTLGVLLGGWALGGHLLSCTRVIYEYLCNLQVAGCRLQVAGCSRSTLCNAVRCTLSYECTSTQTVCVPSSSALPPSARHDGMLCTMQYYYSYYRPQHTGTVMYMIGYIRLSDVLVIVCYGIVYRIFVEL